SRARDLYGQAARRARRGGGCRRVHPDPRRQRLHEGVWDRARVARHAPQPDRRGHRRDHARGDRPLVRDLGAIPLTRWATSGSVAAVAKPREGYAGLVVSARGQLLIAGPTLLDPNFFRTVV